MTVTPRHRVAIPLVGLALAGALSGCSSVMLPAAGTEGPAPAAPAPSATAGQLREVHSPGAVDVDLRLEPGDCHVRTIRAVGGLFLPDPSCTPGAVDPAVTQADIGTTICRRGYTRTIRPPESDTGPAKRQSLADYGLSYSPTVEYDHLVPLELGGANSVSNLWPEPNRAGAHNVDNPKDAVENRLRAAVCAGQVPLAAAQQAIAANWITAEARLGITSSSSGSER